MKSQPRAQFVTTLVAPSTTYPAAVMPAALAGYEYNWDRLRVVASLDIVGSHLGGAHLFGGLGTPLFMMVAVALGVQRPHAGDWSAFAKRRVERVLAPWLFWSLAIGTWLALEAHLRGASAWSFVRPEMLLYGPQIHLWFLPTVACAGMLAYAAHRASQQVSVVGVAALALALGVGALAICPHVGKGWPFEQWSFSVPAVLLGFGVGRLKSRAARSDSASLAACMLVCASAALLLGLALPDAWPYARRYAAALILLSAAAWLPAAPDRLTPKLAALTFGTYVLHPWCFRVCVEPALRLVGLGSVPWARVGAGFLATLALVALLRRTPLRALL